MARAVGAYVISPTRLRKANFRAKIVNIHNMTIFTIFALKFTLRRRVRETTYAPTNRAIVPSNINVTSVPVFARLALVATIATSASAE